MFLKHTLALLTWKFGILRLDADSLSYDFHR
jgi:hypothetical protein